MTILRHLDKPRTVADLCRLTGWRHPEVVEALRPLIRRGRVAKIRPTTIHDRATRYQRIQHDERSRGSGSVPSRAEGHDPDGGADLEAVPRLESTDAAAVSAPRAADDPGDRGGDAGNPGARGTVGRHISAAQTLTLAALGQVEQATTPELATATGLGGNQLRYALETLEGDGRVARVGRIGGGKGGRWTTVWALGPR